LLASAAVWLPAQPTPPGRIEFSGMIYNRGSGKCVDVQGGSTARKADVRQWACTGRPNQLWEVYSLGRGEYAVRNVGSGQVLDVMKASRDNGANVAQYPWNGGPNQRWRRSGSKDNFQLINVNSGKCLDVSGASTDNGADISQYACHGRANQRWTLGYRMNPGGRPR